MKTKSTKKFDIGVKTLLPVLIGVAIVIGFFLFEFQAQPLSGKTEHWGQFGDYLGGTLNPFLSFITIIILIATLKSQKEELATSKEDLELTRIELRKTAEAATNQALHLEKQAALSEIQLLIEKLATRINRNFNENRLERDGSIHRFVQIFKKKKNSNYVEMYSALYTQEGSATQETVNWIRSDLHRLAVLIKKYEEIARKNSTTTTTESQVPGYYQEEFGDMVEALYINGMLDGNLMEFYRPCKQLY
ncbi:MULTISPECIES: hypothetical protein [Pseudomonas]|uniref:hypothetical protein n=1 Tax=Pseudomonas TaxID=286 RepID=UPI0012E09AD7|nr:MULTISPECIES: hypothetical protein [Pseudomonas]